MLDLREYQREIVEKVVSLYQQNPRGAAKIVLATGLGKTIIFSAIAHEIRKCSADITVLIIAHRDELLNQAAEKYRLIDPMAIIGKVGSGIYQWGAPITVASIQTICRDSHLKHLALFNYGLVIVDECHHVHGRNEYGKVLSALPHAFKIGVTATDMRLDKRSNDSIFGKPVITYGIRWGIAEGYLCDLRAIAIRTQTTLDIATRKNMEGEIDYQIGELANAIDTEARNNRVVDAWNEHAQGRRTICFGATVAHAEHLAEAFQRRGIAAAVVSGDTPHDERQRLYAALASGSLKIISTVQVLTEGFDLPRLDCIVMARPTQSTGLFLQCIGRGTRKAPGKQDCLILDLTDNVLRHQLEPVSLSKALDLHIKDGESVKDAEARASRENTERQVQVRKLRARRERDLEVNLLESLIWQERTDDLYVLEVGREKHRIALVPTGYGTYDVWARLFPSYEGQQWGNNLPLDWAQELAERKARLLLSDPKAILLVDRNASWRKEPASDNQKKFLDWKHIPYHPEITKGEAGDLIDEWKRQNTKIQQKVRTR